MVLPEVGYEKAKQITDEFLAKSQKIKDETLKAESGLYISGGATYFNETDSQRDIGSL